MPSEQQRKTVSSNDNGPLANNALPQGNNLHDRFAEAARLKGVPLNVLTNQLRTDLSNAFSQEMNNSLNFYGKAVDETKVPLSDATATISCLIFPEKQIMTNILTDMNGLFEFHFNGGQAISISVTKQGYEEVPGTNEHHFVYYGVVNGFQADPHNPVIFTLRNKSSGQK
jgi:hypothetical protein